MKSKGKNNTRPNLSINERKASGGSIPVKSSGIFSSNLVNFGSRQNLEMEDTLKNNYLGSRDIPMHESIDLSLSKNQLFGLSSGYSGVSNRLTADPSTLGMNKIKKARNLNTDHGKNKKSPTNMRDSSLSDKRNNLQFNSDNEQKSTFDNRGESIDKKRSSSYNDNFMLNKLSQRDVLPQGMSKKAGASTIGGISQTSKVFGAKVGTRSSPHYYDDNTAKINFTTEITNHEVQPEKKTNEIRVEDQTLTHNLYESPLARGMGSIGR